MRVLKRMFLIVETAAVDTEAGTDSPVTLVCTVDNVDVINYTVIDSPQNDFDTGQANCYEIPLPRKLVKEKLSDGSFRVEIRGDDWWLPKRVFVIATDSMGRSHVLVNIPDWTGKGLSTDPLEGKTSYPLPLSD